MAERCGRVVIDWPPKCSHMPAALPSQATPVHLIRFLGRRATESLTEEHPESNACPRAKPSRGNDEGGQRTASISRDVVPKPLPHPPPIPSYPIPASARGGSRLPSVPSTPALFVLDEKTYMCRAPEGDQTRRGLRPRSLSCQAWIREPDRRTCGFAIGRRCGSLLAERRRSPRVLRLTAVVFNACRGGGWMSRCALPSVSQVHPPPPFGAVPARVVHDRAMTWTQQHTGSRRCEFPPFPLSAKSWMRARVPLQGTPRLGEAHETQTEHTHTHRIPVCSVTSSLPFPTLLPPSLSPSR
ncbi:hypothetical protein LY76DRAFT_299927 [Colletotrichum caudatum]|nr:hypothetical protein LY76DRAFT_299927 [Colletotrichum caudatum]